MPIASSDVYVEMLDRAKAGAFAYPAINVSSSQTLNAAIRGFAEAESDGIKPTFDKNRIHASDWTSGLGGLSS